MTIPDIINSVIAGGLLGSIGQGIRLAVGLKKLSAENSKKQLAGDTPDPISSGRMILSIFIGFVAGAIGMIIKGASLAKNGDYDTESIITIIAIGYSGADFIEGVFNTYLTKFDSSSNPTSTETTTKPAISGQVSTDSQNNSVNNSDEDIVG